MPIVSESAQLLTPSEVAEILRVKLSTVYAAAATGRLPAIQVWRGRRKSLLRFRRADIERLISGAGDAKTTDTPTETCRSSGRR
jgi:excisionase family DNA binding protein